MIKSAKDICAKLDDLPGPTWHPLPFGKSSSNRKQDA